MEEKLSILLSIKNWHCKVEVELYCDLDFNHTAVEGQKMSVNYGRINFILSNISFFSVIFLTFDRLFSRAHIEEECKWMKV